MLLEDYYTVMQGGVPCTHAFEAAIVLGDGCHISERTVRDGMEILTIVPGNDEVLRISIETPLKQGVGYWHPNATSRRTLAADWMGNDRTSLVFSVPLGCLYDPEGKSILAFSFDAIMREATLNYGVSEENKSFVVLFQQKAAASRPVKIALTAPGMLLENAVAQLGSWLEKTSGRKQMRLPMAGQEPVYSTWYGYSQAISADLVETDAAIAHGMGCRAVFIDDGWQALGNGRYYAGCGDWIPDTKKFPDFAGTVNRLQAKGMAVVAWVAPLMLGNESDAFASLGAFAPYWSESWRCHILDPRYAEVRTFFVETCVRLLTEYKLDGLKIDFVDPAMFYAGTPSEGDFDDVGEAMLATFEALHAALNEAHLQNLLIEFRQPYIGPGIAPFANMFRAGDCPADAIVNRRSIIDTGMLISSGAAVHADPIVWDASAGAEAAARQLMAAYFSVPQVSMRLHGLPDAHRRVVKFFLQQWLADRQVIMNGDIHAGLPCNDYPIVQCWTGKAHGVIGVYSRQVVDADLKEAKTITILNATPCSDVVLNLAATTGPAWVDVKSPDGTLVQSTRHRFIAGVQLLEVPPYGIATLDFRDD